MPYLPSTTSDNDLDRQVAFGLERARAERARIFRRLLSGRLRTPRSLG